MEAEWLATVGEGGTIVAPPKAEGNESRWAGWESCNFSFLRVWETLLQLRSNVLARVMGEKARDEWERNKRYASRTFRDKELGAQETGAPTTCSIFVDIVNSPSILINHGPSKQGLPGGLEFDRPKPLGKSTGGAGKSPPALRRIRIPRQIHIHVFIPSFKFIFYFGVGWYYLRISMRESERLCSGEVVVVDKMRGEEVVSTQQREFETRDNYAQTSYETAFGHLADLRAYAATGHRSPCNPARRGVSTPHGIVLERIREGKGLSG
ncbi:hypothetical protein BDN72DRAFT_859586 [Pluteus cervinus]|uniref:Uncharacterized protein n=1 Tax=Pluteus cervinus TaxID=181527 RepID=A0ACD3AMZ1_9AGAR|nr:hypothetical protein BDN72DRAFT_859586 [Pluteus cervinus]